MATSETQPINKKTRQALTGEVGGQEIMVTPRGQVLVGGERMKGLPNVDGVLTGKGGQGLTEQKKDPTARMIESVLNLMIWTDPDLVLKLRSGEESLENVLDRVAVILRKMAATQKEYESHRLAVDQIDAAQKALKSISELAGSRNPVLWLFAPEKVKGLAISVLEDVKITQAIVLAAGLTPEQMAKGMANYQAIVEAAARTAMEQQLVGVRAQRERDAMTSRAEFVEGRREQDSERVATKDREAHRLANLELAAAALSRSGKGTVELANYAVGKSGISVAVAEGVGATVEKLKEPQVVGFLIGGTLGLVEGSLLAAALTVGGPVTWVPVAVVAGSWLAGGALGARIPGFFGWLGDRLVRPKVETKPGQVATVAPVPETAPITGETIPAATIKSPSVRGRRSRL